MLKIIKRKHFFDFLSKGNCSKRRENVSFSVRRTGLGLSAAVALDRKLCSALSLVTQVQRRAPTTYCRE